MSFNIIQFQLLTVYIKDIVYEFNDSILSQINTPNTLISFTAQISHHSCLEIDYDVKEENKMGLGYKKIVEPLS
jgi:hypothetical protein